MRRPDYWKRIAASPAKFREILAELRPAVDGCDGLSDDQRGTILALLGHYLSADASVRKHLKELRSTVLGDPLLAPSCKKLLMLQLARFDTLSEAHQADALKTVERALVPKPPEGGDEPPGDDFISAGGMRIRRPSKLQLLGRP